jgi:O-antigen ligase
LAFVDRLPALARAHTPAIGLAAACIFMPIANRISPFILVSAFVLCALPLIWLEGVRGLQGFLARARAIDKPAKLAWGLVLALLVYAVLTAPFGARPDKGLTAAVSVLALCATGFLFIHLTRVTVSAANMAILGVGMAVGTVVVAAGLFDLIAYVEDKAIALNRPVVVTSLVTWLVLAWIFTMLSGKRAWIAAGVLVAVVVAVTLKSESQSALLGLMAGAFGLALARGLGRAGVILVGLGAAILFIAFPFIVPFLSKMVPPDLLETAFLSAGHSDIRLEIWEQFSQTIQIHPLTGWGYYSSRYIPIDVVQAALPAARLDRLSYMHPHSVSVQVWVELGFIGAVGFAMLLIVSAVGISRLDPDRRGFALASYCAILAVSMVSHGFFQSWWLALVFLVIAAFPPSGARESAFEAQRTRAPDARGDGSP